jgi:hypothetical protein
MQDMESGSECELTNSEKQRREASTGTAQLLTQQQRQEQQRRTRPSIFRQGTLAPRRFLEAMQSMGSSSSSSTPIRNLLVCVLPGALVLLIFFVSLQFDTVGSFVARPHLHTAVPLTRTLNFYVVALNFFPLQVTNYALYAWVRIGEETLLDVQAKLQVEPGVDGHTLLVEKGGVLKIREFLAYLPAWFGLSTALVGMAFNGFMQTTIVYPRTIKTISVVISVLFGLIPFSGKNTRQALLRKDGMVRQPVSLDRPRPLGHTSCPTLPLFFALNPCSPSGRRLGPIAPPRRPCERPSTDSPCGSTR